MIHKMASNLHIAAILQKNFAISQEDAQKIYPQLETAIRTHQPLMLSFEGLENCSTIFLRNTLGQLYLSYGTQVDKFIQITNVPVDDILQYQLERLKERALNYQEYKPIFEQAIGNA
jgi:hypothetical protein